MRVLSLGAGVQSTAVLLMTLEGELPPVDAAIFADTQWEPAEVYGHLWWLAGKCAEKDLPLYVVTAGNIRDDALNVTKRFASMPLYVDSGGIREGQMRRQCTREYKIAPVRKQIRTLLGLKPGQRVLSGTNVDLVFGISLDEVQRMRDSADAWITHVYPLVDNRMTRSSCVLWLMERGIRAPRSACIGCPYHSNAEWRRIKESPAEWEDAVGFDREVRRQFAIRRYGNAYLHRSLRPLDEVDLRTEEDRGQGSLLDECEGMCGL